MIRATMRHKKIPSKNRKKLKSVDPFNKKGEITRQAAKKKRNWEPKAEDDQPLPRALVDLKENMALVMDKKQMKKKRQHRNKILEEAARAGMKKGRFEGMDQFVKRVERMTYAAVADHKLMVTQGLAGRSQAEIDADYAEIDAKEALQKEAKKREIQNKIKEAKKKRLEAAKKLKEKLEAKIGPKLNRLKEIEAEEEEEKIAKGEGEDSEEDEREDDESDEDDQFDEKDKPNFLKRKTVDELAGTAAKEDKNKIKKKRLGGSDKLRLKKREGAATRETEKILNAREIIKFGDRYDAPPKFEGLFKEKMDPLMAKAGGKNLLLHSILAKQSDEKTEYLEKSKKRAAVDEMDRQKVIDAYREMKKKKRDANNL